MKISPLEELKMLSKAIFEANSEEVAFLDYLERLTVVPFGNLIHVDFYGNPFHDYFGRFLETIAKPEIAQLIYTLKLHGPDEGANGTRSWDLSELCTANTEFENLRELFVEQTKYTDHNRTVIGEFTEEDGMLGNLLEKAPKIQKITSPSAPNATFFQAENRPISFLDIDVGYEHQDFILNLSSSSAFPDLRELWYGEYNETYMEDFPEGSTPFEHFEKLFKSKAFSKVRLFVWKNPQCSQDEIQALKSLRPNLRFVVLNFSQEVVK